MQTGYYTNTNSCDSVESWELRFKLPSPSKFYGHREVEVTSVNWEQEPAVASQVTGQVLVSYRWHGIMYGVELLTVILSFTFRLVQMLGPKKKDCCLAVVNG